MNKMFMVMELTQEDYFYPRQKGREVPSLQSRGEEGLHGSAAGCRSGNHSSLKAFPEGKCYP